MKWELSARNSLYDHIFDLEEVKKSWKVEELINESLWVAHNYNPDEEGYCWLDFAFFEFSSQILEVEGAPIMVKLLMHGNGPTDCKTQRECRHTYWGDKSDGYIFYPKEKNILAALNWLKTYFDLD